ncbi:hypothetical protein GMMP1_540054 [Candidatus Magnetomoraceae bacterium gMMP-1]
MGSYWWGIAPPYTSNYVLKPEFENKNELQLFKNNYYYLYKLCFRYLFCFCRKHYYFTS